MSTINLLSFYRFINDNSSAVIDYLKKGNKIHIKKSHEGLFTLYCGGNVTEECIQRGLHSSDPKIRRRANFARNSRSWGSHKKK